MIAIDDREKALRIVEFARHHNPNIKILARAYDRIHGFKLHRAKVDRIVRETFAGAVKSGRHALELLGMERPLAEEVVALYAERDHISMKKVAALYDPNAKPFTNKRLIDVSNAEDAQTEAMMRALIRGEAVEWPDEDADGGEG